jgi:hypothetical protein
MASLDDLAVEPVPAWPSLICEMQLAMPLRQLLDHCRDGVRAIGDFPKEPNLALGVCFRHSDSKRRLVDISSFSSCDAFSSCTVSDTS